MTAGAASASKSDRRSLTASSSTGGGLDVACLVRLIRAEYCPGASGLRIDQQTPRGPGVDVGRRCSSTRTHWIGLRPVAHHRRAKSHCGATGGPAAEWALLVARSRATTVSAGCAQARQEGGASCHAAAFGAPPFRADAAPSWRRSAAAPAPPRPTSSAARPPASSPGDLRRRPYSCCPPATPVCRSACQADDTRRCPELVSRSATGAERREPRGDT